MLLLLGFAMPLILQLRNVPHNRVIRREQEAPQASVRLTYGIGLAMFVGLLLWQTGDVESRRYSGDWFLGRHGFIRRSLGSVSKFLKQCAMFLVMRRGALRSQLCGAGPAPLSRKWWL